LLLYGIIGRDSTMAISALYVLTGVIVWLSLIVVFHQHRLERLETLEESELREARPDASIFDASREETGLAARRLRQMYKWMLPIASLLAASLLVIFSAMTFVWFERLEDPENIATIQYDFTIGDAVGWQIAICLGFAVVAFILSRFVAGMSKQPEWQNLRGGAGYMVGNALVCLAIAVGIVFTIFEKSGAMRIVAQGILIFMIAVAAEILLNFILNLYRPRRSGELPRPAFDSRILSLLAAPDSIVRSINEAVNYQFGFDITSSWGYQLLLRSITWLLVFGVVAMLLLSTVVVVEPNQQAVRLRFGEVVGGVRQGEVVFKLPWPFETVETYDVGLLQDLPLGLAAASYPDISLWSQESDNSKRRSFLVAAPEMSDLVRTAVEGMELSNTEFVAASSMDPSVMPGIEAEYSSSLGARFALIDADIILRWRVKTGKLIEFLEFSSASTRTRSRLDMREEALQSIALRVVSQFLARQSLNEVLSPAGRSLLTNLQNRVQEEFDARETGVEVVSLVIPWLRPAGESAASYEDMSIETENARKIVEEARRSVAVTMGALVGDVERANEAARMIDELRDLEREQGEDGPDARKLRAEIEKTLLEGRAQAASLISKARAKRWQIITKAQEAASEVLGQSAAFHAAPELYRQRMIMDVLASTLTNVRMKYILGPSADRVDVNIQMREPDVGFNLEENIQRKDDGS
jgi:regulator of protease activity HflC (stomatin/prohibitin superfamily)